MTVPATPFRSPRPSTRRVSPGAAAAARVATRGRPIPDHDVGVVRDAAEAVSNAHDWFARNDGWAPPDADTLADWVAGGMWRSPGECFVAPGGLCVHRL